MPEWQMANGKCNFACDADIHSVIMVVTIWIYFEGEKKEGRLRVTDMAARAPTYKLLPRRLRLVIMVKLNIRSRLDERINTVTVR